MEQDASSHTESAPQEPPPPPSPETAPPLPPPPPIEIEKDFILTLESLPVLWDKTHSNYSNKYKRNDALQKLLQIYTKIKLGATIDDVKKKINVLRSNYRRELKKIVISRRSGAGTNEIYRPKSWTFEYLKFLEKFEQPIPLDGNTGDKHNEAKSDSPYPDKEINATISSFESALPPPEKPTPLNSKKNVLKKQNELLERACSYLEKPVGSQIRDGMSIAFEWAETLQRLTHTQKLYAKKAINDILFEAELGNLNRHSVQINVTSPSSPASSLYSNTPSPNYMHTQTAPPIQSPQYVISHISSPPETSPHCNYTHTEVIAPPAQSLQYTMSQISSASTSSLYSHTPSAKYVHTQVTAPLAQSEYIVHNPSPCNMAQDNEYTAATLFAQFNCGTDNGDE